MMGWLGLTYVACIYLINDYDLQVFFKNRIISTAVLMWRYSVINAEKEALCKREGIDDSREEEFRELGDESPLFRFVGIHLAPLLFSL